MSDYYDSGDEPEDYSDAESVYSDKSGGSGYESVDDSGKESGEESDNEDRVRRRHKKFTIDDVFADQFAIIENDAA